MSEWEGEAQESLDIAIVGMAGRFPGAPDLDAFWRNLAAGVELIARLSDDELAARGVEPHIRQHPRFVPAAPELADIDLFDAGYFAYAPREAEVMDPQHRIFLECAVAALEDAGYWPASFDGLIGVYAGTSLSTYLLFNLLNNPDINALEDSFSIMVGNDKDFLSTRLSYQLNLRGPSLDVQTGCSTSLVAVHLACQSLLSYQCDLALAGGVSVNVPQRAGYLYEEGGIVSPDGHCRAFDAQGGGTIFGSGAGLVVLKRLDDALAAGDSIRAVIKGSAINNDGNLKVGYTAPSVDGQAEVIARAQAIAGVEPETITYVEAHGTGTALGDPIEVQALTKAFRAATSRSSFCALGSVKSNIGHLDAAAGIASLIKATLALQHQQLPPSLHVQQPNPACAFDTSPFYVNTSLAPWPAADHPRRAGVSSFGIGGTNAHLILEEAPPAPAPAPAAPAQVLLLSARSPAALDQLTQRLAAHLRAQPSLALADLAFTLHAGRRPLPVRRALLAPDYASALAALEQPAITVHSLPQGGRERGVALLLPGQSGTLPRLSPSLAAIAPVFQRELARCASLLRPLLARDLLALLAPHSSLPDPLPTALAQPAGFALAWALAQQWLAWGLHPQALLGHSLGELVAATLAQVFSLEDALALVVKRGQLMQQATPGQMLVVALDASTLRARLDPALDLAAVNGPQQCVIAGPAPAIQSCAAQFHSEGIQTHLLPGAHAFHSRALDAVVAPFAAAVAQVRRQPPQIAFLSNLSGTWITPAQATDPHYWGQHLRAPVLFQPALAELLNQGPWLLLEAGAGQALSGLARRAGADAVVPSLGGASGPVEGTTLLQAAGQVWQLGGALDPLALHGPGRRRIPLPTYPFQRQRFWIAPGPPGTPRASSANRPIDDWFYLPAWRRTLLPDPATPLDPARRWLLFDNGSERMAQLQQRLEAAGQEVLVVAPGDAFQSLTERRFQVAAGATPAYDALIAHLAERQLLPQSIVHGWTMGQTGSAGGEPLLERMQRDGFASLLALAQALGRHAATHTIDLWALSEQIYPVSGGEVCHPEKAILLGPCKVIPQEYPQIACRLLDLPAPGAPAQEARLIEALATELAHPARDRVIAYRGGQRLVQTFEPLHLEQAAAPFRQGGVYVVFGGLGAIGLTLAEHLAANYQARLALVGRTGLPPRAEWETWLAQHGPDDPQSQRMRQVQAIEQSAAEVLILSADITDSAQVGAALDQATATFGALHGVIHVAGAAGSRAVQLIQDFSPAAAELHFGPKIHGLYALAHALEGRTIDMCLCFSSNAAVLGGIGLAGYAAAHLFMDAFAARQCELLGSPWISLTWDPWVTSHDSRSAYQTSIERFSVPAAEGLTALQRAVGQPRAGQIVVSRGDLAARMATWIYQDGPQEPRLPLPATLAAGSERAAPHVAPSSELELAVVRVWQDALGVADIGIHDNFFELGGTSLIGIKLIGRLNEALQLDLPVVILFEAPTISTLAGVIQQNQLANPAYDKRRARGALRRENMQRRTDHVEPHEA